MQIYNNYFNLPNYFAFFCRLHLTEPIGISGFYAPSYKNQLVIETIEGTIVGVFTGDVPKLEFKYQNKDQLVFYVILTNDFEMSK